MIHLWAKNDHLNEKNSQTGIMRTKPYKTYNGMGIKVSGLKWCADRIPVNIIFWHLNGCSFLKIYTCFGGNNPDPPSTLCLSGVERRSISAVAWNKKLLHEELQKSCWNEDPSEATKFPGNQRTSIILLSFRLCFETVESEVVGRVPDHRSIHVYPLPVLHGDVWNLWRLGTLHSGLVDFPEW